MTRIGILLSGRGSNFLAIHEAIHQLRLPAAEIAVVLSNHPEAPGLAAATALNLPTFAIPAKGPTPEARAAHEAELLARLHQHKVDLVCLAGYMRILTPLFIDSFPNRILNIHPSLLPAFPGAHAQADALASGARVSGCTVHFVDALVDHGVIVAQRPVPILDEDTPDTLAARILEQEHLAYPEAIAKVISGHYEIQGRRYLKRPEAGTVATPHLF